MNNIKNRNGAKTIFAICILGLLFSLSLQANPLDSVQSIFDAMQYQEVLKVELETDLELLQNDRYLKDPLPARISFKDKNGVDQHWNIKVGQRGKFRRVHCSELPPLKLNFKKGDLEAAGLASWDDMKLVTHCVEDWDAAKELLLREYLTYKLFNEISDQSFRVQLLKISYVDINTGKKIRQWGFLIEDTAQLKARLNATSCEECYNLPIEQFEKQQLERVSLFQFFIGNSDWSIVNMRNVKLLEAKNQVLPIPYDFDFSGLVNASYALPNALHKMDGIQDRVFLGFEESIEGLDDVKAQFLHEKENLTQIVQDFKILSSNSRREITAYMISFFEEDIHQIQRMEKKPIQTLSAPKR